MSFDGGYHGSTWPQPDVTHEPGCLRVGTQSFDRGRRANGDSVWELWCVDCRARLILINGRPESQAEAPAQEPTLDKPTPTRAEPIATPAEADAAYAEYGSDRKAAKALGISRTHLRRLRGVQE